MQSNLLLTTPIRPKSLFSEAQVMLDWDLEKQSLPLLLCYVYLDIVLTGIIVHSPVPLLLTFDLG